MVKKEWNGILAEKEVYLKGEWNDLSEFQFIRQDVLASWENAKRFDFGQEMISRRKIADPELLQETTRKYSFIIEITSSMMDTFQGFVKSDFAFYLCDTNCMLLLQAGDLIEEISKTDKIVGSIMDEESIGTSSHLLCIQQQKPIQLLGPEHYCRDFWNFVGSSAPIFDQNDRLIGSIDIIQRMPKEPWLKQFEDFCAYTLGFLTTMANVISLQLKLSSKNEHLKAIKILKQWVIP